MNRIDPTEMLLIAGILVGGAALVMSARLLRTWMARSSAAQTALRYPGYLLLAIGSLGGLTILMDGMGFFAWLIMMGIWIRAAIHYRATQRRNLFSGLTLAVDKQMPLGPMAMALAQEPDAGFSTQARTLAHHLERGDRLSDALAQSWRILPPESALVAKVGAESGDLAAALEATTYGSRFDRSVLQPLVARSAYVLVVLTYFAAILIFLQFKVGPSFVKIFDDFQARISEPFILLVRLSQTAWPYVWLLGLTLLLPLYVWLQWRGTLFPRLPGLRRVVNWVDVGPLLRMLALAAERHRPLSGIFDAIALFHPKRSVRRRVTQVAREVEAGLPWQQCLERGGLLRDNDAAVLAAAERSGNLAWALNEMANSFERKAAFRLQALTQIILPLIALPLGIVVALVVLAYFTPVVQLIQNLS